jgi:hypothetical protein
MPFTMREIFWMVEGKMEVSNESLNVVIDSLYSSIANLMALTKACHTGKRSSPDDFYKSSRRKRSEPTPGINKDGFAMMKALFAKGK